MLNIPSPFVSTSVALSAYGFDQSHVEYVSVNDSDEILLKLLLYAQSRSRKRKWQMHAEFDYETGEHFRVRNLCVKFEAHLNWCNEIPHQALMNIEYVVAMGRGLFWLELPGISAFCQTQEETICAIDAVVSFVPKTISHFYDCADRIALEVHLWQCLHISGDDKVREMAIRRKMRMMGFFVP